MEQLTVNEQEIYVQGINNEEDKNFLLEKYKEIDEEQTVNLPENKIFYYAGMRSLMNLVNKLNDEDKIKFWKEFDIMDLVFNINNIRMVTNFLIKFFFQTDCEVEALTLIVKDYYNKIYKRININK